MCPSFFLFVSQYCSFEGGAMERNLELIECRRSGLIAAYSQMAIQRDYGSICKWLLPHSGSLDTDAGHAVNSCSFHGILICCQHNQTDSSAKALGSRTSPFCLLNEWETMPRIILLTFIKELRISAEKTRYGAKNHFPVALLGWSVAEIQIQP